VPGRSRRRSDPRQQAVRAAGVVVLGDRDGLRAARTPALGRAVLEVAGENHAVDGLLGRRVGRDGDRGVVDE
jgi:hypothetical protein